MTRIMENLKDKQLAEATEGSMAAKMVSPERRQIKPINVWKKKRSKI